MTPKPNFNVSRRLPWAALCWALAAPAAAQTGPGLQFTGSGFLTLAASKIFSGSRDPDIDSGYHCPCFITDYARAGVVESGGIRLGPDSKVGLQGSVASADGRYSVTGQVVSRGAVHGRVNIEWLYATAELGSDFTLQLGRKRLPLFAYSEVQDVGQAYPWVHLPPQLYGWEIVNFNGASLTWRQQWGPWLSTVNAFAGGETVKDARYWRLYKGKSSHTESHWGGIVGAEMKMAVDGFEARTLVMQSTTRNKPVSEGATEFSDPKRQTIYGAGLSAERGPWTARTEFLYINRRADYGTDRSQLYAVGYRAGAWLSMLSFNNYQQRTNPGVGASEGHSTTSMVLRRDLDSSSAVKLQLDRWRDKSEPGFTSMHGHARMLSLSYDKVF